jgi:hypothetical protein
VTTVADEVQVEVEIRSSSESVLFIWNDLVFGVVVSPLVPTSGIVWATDAAVTHPGGG